jgi:hypothetical protein
VFAVLTTALVAHAAEPITRERILANAAAFAEHVWTCSLDNQFGGTACHADWLCDYQAGTTYVGLPYDWGGYVTLDEFEQDLQDGKGAGSHSEWGVLECTTGLDCSGYVSQCWEVSHHSTSTMDGVAHPIDPDDLQPGDAWNHPGSHIVLWVRQAENGSPVFYEAAGRPVNKVQLNDYAGWSYLEGYTALRADKLEALPPLVVGTLQNPIEIEAFPFVDDNNTDLSTSRLWNAYACAPGTNESGPEIFYRFTLAEAGSLHVSVTDPQGVDVDPHLLASADPQDCLARHDKQFTADLAAGTYWLVADTWVNADGAELPGSYHLEVTFSPGGVGPAPADAVDDAAGDPVGDGAPTDTAREPAGDADVASPEPGADDDSGGGGGGAGGCLWVPASVGYGEALVVFGLALVAGLILRLARRHRRP